ncbi:MAG: hypothetical protein PWR16_156 [Methanoculleus sp.]|nr:hypothetical protein [Methanoculleus sp.]
MDIPDRHIEFFPRSGMVICNQIGHRGADANPKICPGFEGPDAYSRYGYDGIPTGQNP